MQYKKLTDPNEVIGCVVDSIETDDDNNITRLNLSGGIKLFTDIYSNRVQAQRQHIVEKWQIVRDTKEYTAFGSVFYPSQDEAEAAADELRKERPDDNIFTSQV